MDKKDGVNVMLTEYREIRAESRTLTQIQITTMGLTISAFGVLGSLGLNMANSKDSDIRLAFILFFIILPALLAFGGVLWLDQIYRRAIFGYYTSLLEDRINKVFGVEKWENAVIGWENWNFQETKNKKFLAKTNRYYYYVTLGVFGLAPICSIAVGIGIWVIRQKYGVMVLFLSLTSVIIYIVMIIFEFGYCKAISAYSKIWEERQNKTKSNIYSI